jgi:hypothetical protein
MPSVDFHMCALRVSRAQAIALAERHVVAIGLARNSRLELELVQLPWLAVLKDMGGVLEPRAAGASRRGHGWVVAFRHRARRPGQRWGLAVTMDGFGNKIHIEHDEIDQPRANAFSRYDGER